MLGGLSLGIGIGRTADNTLGISDSFEEFASDGSAGTDLGWTQLLEETEGLCGNGPGSRLPVDSLESTFCEAGGSQLDAQRQLESYESGGMDRFLDLVEANHPGVSSTAICGQSLIPQPGDTDRDAQLRRQQGSDFIADLGASSSFCDPLTALAEAEQGFLRDQAAAECMVDGGDPFECAVDAVNDYPTVGVLTERAAEGQEVGQEAVQDIQERNRREAAHRQGRADYSRLLAQSRLDSAVEWTPQTYPDAWLPDHLQSRGDNPHREGTGGYHRWQLEEEQRLEGVREAIRAQNGERFEGEDGSLG